MDIAKIRKKIKEESEIRSPHRVAEGGRSEKEGKTVSIGDPPRREDKPVDETSASTQQQRVTLGETEDRKQKTEGSRQYIVDSIQGAKPQPHAPAQVVSEQEVVTGKSSSESAGKTAKPVVDSSVATRTETLREDAISPSARQTGIIELLTFQLAAEEFAFRISEVEEILTPQQITMVPKAPDYILGITSVRGKVMPVLDLKKRLSIKDNGASGKVRKKILTLKGPKGRIGIMIDRINGVIRIDESDIAEPPAHLSESDLMFVGGVVLYNGRFISVLRLEAAADINLK